jgi:hypothetical protein
MEVKWQVPRVTTSSCAPKACNSISFPLRSWSLKAWSEFLNAVDSHGDLNLHGMNYYKAAYGNTAREYELGFCSPGEVKVAEFCKQGNVQFWCEYPVVFFSNSSHKVYNRLNTTKFYLLNRKTCFDLGESILKFTKNFKIHTVVKCAIIFKTTCTF